MKRLFVLLLIALAPAGAFAVPVNYTFTMGPVSIAPDGGVGSLFWDADTHTLSNLTWDFGGGQAGGVDDGLANWSFEVFGGTFAEFTFEILSGEDVHPVGCAVTVSCSTNFGPGNGLYGWPATLVQWNLFFGGTRSYFVWNGPGNLAFGDVSAATPSVAVAEPGTLALLMSGLAGLVLLRRKRGNG